MKRSFCILGSLLLGAGLVYAEAIVGQPAPDFTATDIDGKKHRLGDYQGKIVVLEAYNLDCPFCANHFKSGAMQELQADMTKEGVVWLVVNSSHPKSPSYRSADAAKKEWAKQKMKATAWIADADGTVGKAYDLKTTPHMVVIDTKGIVAYNGAIDDRAESEGDPRRARNYVREAVKAVKEGKSVAVSKTKPYGCGVKYAD
jgi:peroxiredoxin